MGNYWRLCPFQGKLAVDSICFAAAAMPEWGKKWCYAWKVGPSVQICSPASETALRPKVVPTYVWLARAGIVAVISLQLSSDNISILF